MRGQLLSYDTQSTSESFTSEASFGAARPLRNLTSACSPQIPRRIEQHVEIRSDVGVKLFLYVNSEEIAHGRSRDRIRAIFRGKTRMSDFKVGQHVTVKLSGGRLIDAEINAIIETTEGKRLQVSFGEETARIHLWQVVEKLR